MARAFIRRLGKDAHFYRQLTHRGAKPSRLGLLWAIASNRGLWLLAMHRIAHHGTKYRNPRSPRWWVVRVLEGLGRYLSAACCKSEILEDCDLAAGIYLSAKGYLICGARRIGAGSLIHDHVTIGYGVANGSEGRPTIGEHVWIGPHCVIAGPLTIGDGATVLPSSYVTRSVPARAVVGGNPARVIRQNFDNSELRSSLNVSIDLPAEAHAAVISS